MDNLLEQISLEINFLKPYYKQLINKLDKESKILVCGSNENKIKEFDINYEIIDTIDKAITNKYNGIILENKLDNLDENNIKELFNIIDNILLADGYVLVINKEIKYTKEELDFIIKDKFILSEELIGDNKWNFLIYEKNTTK